MTRFVVEVELESLYCAECGAVFALPNVEQLRENHLSFSCPNGHSLSFRGKSDADKWREKAEQAQAEVARLEREREARRQMTANAREARRRKLRAVS